MPSLISRFKSNRTKSISRMRAWLFAIAKCAIVCRVRSSLCNAYSTRLRVLVDSYLSLSSACDTSSSFSSLFLHNKCNGDVGLIEPGGGGGGGMDVVSCSSVIMGEVVSADEDVGIATVAGLSAEDEDDPASCCWDWVVLGGDLYAQIIVGSVLSMSKLIRSSVEYLHARCKGVWSFRSCILIEKFLTLLKFFILEPRLLVL